MLIKVFGTLVLLILQTQAWRNPTRAPPLRKGSPCNFGQFNGTCTLIHECTAFIKNQIEYKQLGRCTFEGIFEIVCCPKQLRASEIACQKIKEANPGGSVPHIIGGVQTSVGDLPHIGAVLYPSSKAGQKYEMKCGAVLISDRFALTAAHCVFDKMPEIIRFGTVEWDPESNETYRLDALVKNIIIHEDYKSSKIYNDIALIEFSENVNMSLYVSPACLYTEREDLPSSQILQIAGWGHMSTRKRKISPFLMKANVTTVPLNKCEEEYALNLRFSYDAGIGESQYCTTSDNMEQDACQGDSGGPLVLESYDIFHVVGIVSSGEGCASDMPSIYIRVSHYIRWIEKKVWPDL